MSYFNRVTLIELSAEAFEEIERKVRAAGYESACSRAPDGRIVVSMGDIAFVAEIIRLPLRSLSLKCSWCGVVVEGSIDQALWRKPTFSGWSFTTAVGWRCPLHESAEKPR